MAAIIENERQLTEWDTISGDGDCGLTLKKARRSGVISCAACRNGPARLSWQDYNVPTRGAVDGHMMLPRHAMPPRAIPFSRAIGFHNGHPPAAYCVLVAAMQTNVRACGRGRRQ